MYAIDTSAQKTGRLDGCPDLVWRAQEARIAVICKLYNHLWIDINKLMEPNNMRLASTTHARI